MSRLRAMEPDDLLGLVLGRRWFARTGHDPACASLADVVHDDDDLELGLVDVAFADGGSALYLVALDAGGEDALGDRTAVRRLLALCGVDAPCEVVRPAGEQTNSAAVVEDAYLVKLYRRIEPGPGVEAELLDALEQEGFGSAPRLRGRLDHRGATLAIVTDYVPALGDGWQLASAGLAAGDPWWLPERARRLGEVTGTMHAALATAALEPASPAAGAVASLAPELEAELDELARSPVGPRIGELRDLLRDLVLTSEAPALAARIHGDYHLAQVLWGARGEWVVIDLEGEPTRSLAERRRRAFALRDVAGMTRSFAYAADFSRLIGGIDVPEGWEERCRSAFLAGWRATVDARLVPATETGMASLLGLFELQKLLYELRYELAHRPDWVAVPLAGLERLLERA